MAPEVEVEARDVVEMPVPVPEGHMQPAQIMADPELIVANATRASKALMSMIDAHGPKFLSTIRGNPYPKFEAWQMIGAFFTCTAAVESVEELVEGGAVVGYACWAIVVDVNGIQKGRARAVCMNDESSWDKWPAGDLANAVQSKAQTRAQAKALRGMFAWVAALGGLQVTPAEEMELVPDRGGSAPTKAPATTPSAPRQQSSRPQPEERPQPPSRGGADNGESTEKQMNYAFVLMRKLDSEFAAVGITEDEVWGYFCGKAKVDSRTDLKRKHWSQLIDGLKGMLDGDDFPIDAEVKGFASRVKEFHGVAPEPTPPPPADESEFPQEDIPF